MSYTAYDIFCLKSTWPYNMEKMRMWRLKTSIQRMTRPVFFASLTFRVMSCCWHLVLLATAWSRNGEICKKFQHRVWQNELSLCHFEYFVKKGFIKFCKKIGFYVGGNVGEYLEFVKMQMILYTTGISKRNFLSIICINAKHMRHNTCC